MPLPAFAVALAPLALSLVSNDSDSIWDACVDVFNKITGHAQEIELEEKRRETQLKIAYAQMASQWKLQENSQDFELKMEADRQQFQTKLVEYQCQENRKLQEFIKAVDVAIAKSNQEFQTWLFYQQKDLQMELAEYNLQGQLKVAMLQRETARQMEEYRIITENFPISLMGQEIIDSHGGGDRVPLRVIISPPTINHDEFATPNPDFPDIETDLSQDLKDFVEKYYSLKSRLRPAEFFSGAWRSKKFRGNAAVKRLFNVFKSEPFLILESEVGRKGINLNFAYWSGGQSLYSSKTVFSKFPYREVFNASAKNRDFESEAKNKNKTEMSDEDIDQLCQFLIAYHNLLIAFFADAHYLIHYNLEPQLPQLLLEIIGEFIEDDIGASMLQLAVDGFLVVFKALESDRLALIPDLSIDFAANLVNLPDKSFAQKVLEYSVVSWLKARSLSLGSFEENLATLEAVLVPEDVAYVGKLNRCLAVLKNNPDFYIIGKEFTFEIVTVNSSGKITNRRQGSALQKVEKLASGVTLEMVYIPGGTFTMGSPESEAKRSSDESPQHQVKVPPFYLGKYPVTQAQYQAIMGNNPSSFKGEKRPVENVSWHDAVEFCIRVG